MRAGAAGDIDFGAGGASSAFSLAGTGKLRAIAVTGDTPVDELPDTPTTASLGHPELDMRYWVGVSGPPGLPRDITGKLADAVAAIAERDDVVARLRAVGLEPAVLTGEDLRTAIRREKDRFTTLSDQVGVAG